VNEGSRKKGTAMTRITINDVILAQLSQVKETVEVCDSKGVVVGHFTPLPPAPPLEWGRPQLSDEELTRRAREGPGRTLTEILTDLENAG
jgi:hypothetical protein